MIVYHTIALLNANSITSTQGHSQGEGGAAETPHFGPLLKNICKGLP